MSKFLLVLTIAAMSQAANADQDFYVKDGNGFKKVEKTAAVLAILQNHEHVFKCAEQRLTKKLTLKAISKNDD